MQKILFVTCALLTLAGCGGLGDITHKQAVIQSIVQGESKEQVTQKLGLPGKVKQKEAGKEEWLYCATGIASDTYYKIQMDKGYVTNVSQQSAMLVDGSCSLAYSIPTQEELIEADANKCTAYGLQRGTSAYADCMMKLDSQRASTMQTQQILNAERKSQFNQQLHEMNMRNLHPEQFDKSVHCDSMVMGSNMVSTDCR